jgi:hypothetical protein
MEIHRNIRPDEPMIDDMACVHAIFDQEFEQK